MTDLKVTCTIQTPSDTFELEAPVAASSSTREACSGVAAALLNMKQQCNERLTAVIKDVEASKEDACSPVMKKVKQQQQQS